jgi:hypothetical protein
LALLTFGLAHGTFFSSESAFDGGSAVSREAGKKEKSRKYRSPEDPHGTRPSFAHDLMNIASLGGFVNKLFTVLARQKAHNRTPSVNPHDLILGLLTSSAAKTLLEYAGSTALTTGGSTPLAAVQSARAPAVSFVNGPALSLSKGLQK